jgi:hypothetical protein
MAGRFKSARALYDDKLRPLLLREHALAESDVTALPLGHAFPADDRLVKTLILSAVAPEVPALKELTAARLAALNHGSIVSPLPGQEASVVLSKVRRWQGDVPEIHVSSDNRNPVIRVRIAEVTYESVVEKAKGEDNDGRRREALKRLVWQASGSATSRATRSTSRAEPRCGVARGATSRSSSATNATAAGSESRRSRQAPETWRFVVDHPFDEEGRSARDDLARLDELRAQGLATGRPVDGAREPPRGAGGGGGPHHPGFAAPRPSRPGPAGGAGGVRRGHTHARHAGGRRRARPGAHQPATPVIGKRGVGRRQCPGRWPI